MNHLWDIRGWVNHLWDIRGWVNHLWDIRGWVNHLWDIRIWVNHYTRQEGLRGWEVAVRNIGEYFRVHKSRALACLQCPRATDSSYRFEIPGSSRTGRRRGRVAPGPAKVRGRGDEGVLPVSFAARVVGDPGRRARVDLVTSGSRRRSARPRVRAAIAASQASRSLAQRSDRVASVSAIQGGDREEHTPGVEIDLAGHAGDNNRGSDFLFTLIERREEALVAQRTQRQVRGFLG